VRYKNQPKQTFDSINYQVNKSSFQAHGVAGGVLTSGECRLILLRGVTSTQRLIDAANAAFHLTQQQQYRPVDRGISGVLKTTLQCQNVATSGVLTRLESSKYRFFAWGAHDAPLDPLVGWGGE